jgi:MFS family permease
MTEAPPRRPRAAFESPDFRLWQASRVLSTLAYQAQLVAIGWHVYELTHRALDLGYVGLAQFLPAAGLSLIGGHAADRFDRKRVMLVCNASWLASSLLLLVSAWLGVTSVVPIYVAALMLGTTRAFAGPAGQALVPQLVPKEHFASAVAWSSSLWQLASILGPALGGFVYGLSGKVVTVYATSASLLFLACFFVAGIKVRATGSAPKDITWASLMAGVRYVRSDKLILGSISLDLFAVLLGGATALLPIFARDILHVGAWGLGLLRTAPAIGASAMGALLAYRPLQRRAGKTMLLCVALFGIATIVFGLSHNFALSLVALIVLGASDMVSVVVRQTLVQISTPQDMRGRVSAVNTVFIGASNELGEFESGLTAAWFGAAPAVVLGGIGTLLVVLAWSVLFPKLRDVDSLQKDASSAD